MFSTFLKKMLFARMVDFGEGQIIIMGVPGALISVRMLADALLRTYDAIGKRAFKIFYDAGEQHGRLVGEMAIGQFSMRPEQFSSQFAASGDMLGLGKIEIVTFDLKRQTATRLHGSTLAREVLKIRGVVKFPVDWLFAGIVSGVFNVAFKGAFQTREVRCAAMGAPTCEFIIKPKEGRK